MFTKLSKRGAKEDKNLSCTIRFLDDSEPLSFTYQKDTKGQEIFDQVCHCLDLAEKDYFGLRYIDLAKQRHWLNLLKPLCRQLKYVNPVVLCFRVKFYPSDPTKLKEEITRYFLFLQLRRDLHHGRLLCSQTDANLLAAFILQSEIGDYDPEEHLANYVGKFKMLPKQSHRQEEKIRELHRSSVGQTPAEAELNFLQKSATLETYGVDPHPVKDSNGNLLYLGVTHLGIVIFQGSKRTRIFTWSQVNKITFEGKMFIVHVTITEVKSSGLFDSGNCVVKKHMYGYKCPTLAACKHLWKCAVEQQYFFTLDSSKNAPKVVSGGGVFTRGSRFRFSGRCEKETYKVELAERDEPRFIRTSANPLFAQRYTSLRSGSVPATFNVLGLSEESLDSLNNYKQGGHWRSLDDFSRASSPHGSPIVSEEANDFVYQAKPSEDMHQQHQLFNMNHDQPIVNVYSGEDFMFAQHNNLPFSMNFSSKMDESAEYDKELHNIDSSIDQEMNYSYKNELSARKRQRRMLRHQQKTIYDECLDGSTFQNNRPPSGNNSTSVNNANNTSAKLLQDSSADATTTTAAASTNVKVVGNGRGEVVPKSAILVRLLKYLGVLLLLSCASLTVFLFYKSSKESSSHNLIEVKSVEEATGNEQQDGDNVEYEDADL